ncbi:uroporphyrinogen-III C-methyltransferase [Streptococcus panodentis]|uniref:uroporphyrinogen-III C-methyltransferase n=1 Tax=Streptococcus panodentis TaxID=1581472 RepID=A0ABS5AUB0_9STRE|nr:uroporphyrinogen-III C-methyltransferase [Streptococcus panodentis]MBP2620046.1 uroporphyrinogen-III C-methyltransferase [Streptococcus panodentis]
MSGLVTLLGAGPGDAELLTLKGKRRLQEADVLVFDRLINQELFQHIKADCEKIDVGKKPGQPCIRQEAIEEILIEKARQGKRVVRLKSGDPYIFGRGGEEGVRLAEAGVDFEVVPGITSAVAGLTYAGIPMTYRDVATSFHVFTAHLKDETERLNWEAIAQLKGTLVFLMGMKNLRSIVQELTARGYDESKPAAVIEWGTHPQQRSVDGTLASIADLAEAAAFQAPSVIVVGEVVAFRQQLNFHEQRPLFGRNILIQQSDTGKLPRLLKDAGAALTTFPARTRVEELVLPLPDLERADGLVFADMQSWPLFLKALRSQGRDLRSLSHIRFAAIGRHTAKSIEASGVLLDRMTAQQSDAAFAAALEKEGGSWYILTAEHKQASLEELYSLPVIASHRLAFDSPIERDKWPEIEAVCLPNSAAAMNFVAASQAAGYDWKEQPLVVMGASTRAVLDAAGFDRIVETDEATIASIIDKCREIL